MKTIFVLMIIVGVVAGRPQLDLGISLATGVLGAVTDVAKDNIPLADPVLSVGTAVAGGAVGKTMEVATKVVG